MGCCNSKDKSVPDTDNTMFNRTSQVNQEYKIRLERKMCLAKETPEPDYDLSDCNLKEIPTGVFVMCRVLRKESLDASKNSLQSLRHGGLLQDLALLRIIDLRFNKFQKLPDEIYMLENLRELLVSNNQLVELPTTLNRLRYLELLDVACNKLSNIENISQLPNLRILNISGNPDIRIIPKQLATCESLIDLIFDISVIEEPNQSITNMGTQAILHYLTTNEIINDSLRCDHTTITESTNNFIDGERKKSIQLDIYKTPNQNLTNTFLDQERMAFEKNAMLEAAMYDQQKKQREQLLKQLLTEQNETEQFVNEMQNVKELERSRFITDLLKSEEESSIIVQKLLSMRSEPDPTLLELERKEQELLLEKIHLDNNNLHRKDVLAAMTGVLEEETNRFISYQNEKDKSSRGIIESEVNTNNILSTAFQSHNKNREEMVNNIMYDEELQKSAVATLLEKSDSRSWGLVEQVRIVESQLAALTHYEIERKKLKMDEHMNDLSEKRMELTAILLDLMNQQENRRVQLIDTVKELEKQNTLQVEDYWLIQYQRIMDLQPWDLQTRTQSIDPALGYQFLLNGVVHCLPYLSKLWQKDGFDPVLITDSDLERVGVKSQRDRANILRSIELYLTTDKMKESIVEENKVSVDTTVYMPSAPNAKFSDSKESKEGDIGKGEALAECVVCMEESVKIIFLPCGHLCCCEKCNDDIAICPICRSEIERRIKVIQP